MRQVVVTVIAFDDELEDLHIEGVNMVYGLVHWLNNFVLDNFCRWETADLFVYHFNATGNFIFVLFSPSVLDAFVQCGHLTLNFYFFFVQLSNLFI